MGGVPREGRRGEGRAPAAPPQLRCAAASDAQRKREEQDWHRLSPSIAHTRTTAAAVIIISLPRCALLEGAVQAQDGASLTTTRCSSPSSAEAAAQSP